MNWAMDWDHVNIIWQINPQFFYDLFLMGFNKSSLLNFYLNFKEHSEEISLKNRLFGGRKSVGGPVENKLLMKNSLKAFDSLL